jgi:Zn-dependent oligopeptidase
MFCDSILSDSDWLTRYARNSTGESIPFELIERQITQMQPYEVIGVRSMLMVCYFEKRVYELADADITAENITRIADETERAMLFMPEAPRPLFSVSHIVAGESSAYYHGYVLAEMAVQQTRKYFLETDGYICDNPNVGPTLEEGYWKVGNSVPFIDLVATVTGKPFSADALVDHVNTTTTDAIKEASRKIERAKQTPLYSGSLDLDADISVVNGNEKITEFANGTFGFIVTSQ